MICKPSRFLSFFKGKPVVWVEFCPPKFLHQNPNPSTFKSDLVRQVFLDVINVNEVISMGPNPVWLVSLKEEDV